MLKEIFQMIQRNNNNIIQYYGVIIRFYFAVKKIVLSLAECRISIYNLPKLTGIICNFKLYDNYCMHVI